MTDGAQGDQAIQAENNSIAIGGISVGGNVGDIRIGHTIGYTAEQVSTLITQISTTFQPKPFDGRSPYKGLDVFEEEDAELFFGREKLVKDLASRVKDSCTLFITGPSGSGKSSLVRAGLIHALKQGTAPNSEKWLYATIKPGREPIQTLARAVAGLVMSTNAEDEIRAKALSDETIFARWCEIALRDGRDKRVVLFIDQFEEVFTQISREEERVAFLDLLTHAASVENGRVIILFSMRSDFVTNCATYPKLNALLNQQFVQIGAMQGDELVSAIAQPALRVGLRIDPDLIAQIINDMQGEPGALPLMQFALKDLFDAQQAKGGLIALTLSDYLARGGIRKALERHADQTFAAFSVEEQELARSIFTGLIEIGRGTQDTRRTAIFDELVPASAQSASVEAIVAKLADARLITTDEVAGKDTVTISHEKLIDAWPWLKRLVNENRDVIALQNEIAEDAKEWEEHKRDASYLYSGARLAAAQEKMAAQKILLSGLAKDFIEDGIALREAERKAKESLRRRIITGLTAGIAIALILAGFAVLQMRKAQRQEKIARAGELAAQSVSLREKNFLISLLLGVEAFKETNGIFTSLQVQGALLNNTQTNPHLKQFLSGHSEYVSNVTFSPDGKTLASGSDKGIILWDVASRQPIGQPLGGDSGSVLSVAFSPDGKTLASGMEDSTIILWNVASRQPIGQPLSGHSGSILSIAFSPDGKALASASCMQGGFPCRNGEVILWDVESRQPIGEPLTGQDVYSVAFSPDGKMLASAMCRMTEDECIGIDVILWDVESRQQTGELPTKHEASVSSVVFSPDGNTLASASWDGTIILWDVATREPRGEPLRGHDDAIFGVAFSPDGKTLASGSYDKTIILWDVASRQPIGQPLSGHSDYVLSVAFSPDGNMLASGGGGSTIILWDVASHQLISQPLSGHSDHVSIVAFSADGKLLASGSSDNSIILWDVTSRQRIGQPLSGHSGSISSLAFSPDGKTLASSSEDGIILWDVASHQPIGQPLSGHSELEFSPDGKTLASSGDGIVLWDVASRQPIGQPLGGDSGSVLSVAFSPDGKMLASGMVDSTIILWDVASRQPIGQPLHVSGNSSFISSVAFSPDGKTLASGSDDGTIILWDVASPQPIGQRLSGTFAVIANVAFSPDGRTLVSGSSDENIILWDVASRQPIGQPLSGFTNYAPNNVAFSPDGKTLASGKENSVILWNINPESWALNACERAGRNFTSVEWAQYFPGEEYRKTCEQWPLDPKPAALPTATP